MLQSQSSPTIESSPLDDPLTICSPLAMTVPPPAAETRPNPDCSTSAPSKTTIVRIKRKRLQAPIEALWLEVSERPAKRPELDLGSLSLNDAEGPVSPEIVETRSTRLLFHHLETITSFGAEETSRVDSLLKNAGDGKSFTKWKERRQTLTKNKDHQGRQLTTARETHEALAKTARFEQVWRSRKNSSKDDVMSELFHLYDVVRVDAEAEKQAKREAELAEGQLLHDYLPLLREYLPTAAAQLESEVPSQSTEQDEFVYDVYALEEGADGLEVDNSDYPMVHVIDDEDCRWGSSSESEFDSEDSNDENNPRNEYPEEEDSDLEIESDAEDCTSESDPEIEGKEQYAEDGSEEYIVFSDEYEESCSENDYDSADENQ